ncbi:Cas10/Cmr2 second palm domain-containing protein [Desulfatirhabdium butyrativorans]|uniref:Cas10/Cmr2 second palm domain-containing protein n=1 Tax=Desulfatirhabdium butyrativorans TaxID=340467 RepID=UPI0003FB9DCA|nr:hypothetical protein [Desulfatirhabdium butyrativorans]
MSEHRFVIVFDFPGIKEYVFGTDRLVEIRGASALLDRLNREDLPAIISKTLQTPQHAQKCVFAGGGAAQFILDAPEDRIMDLVRQLQGHIFQESGGQLRLVAGYAPFQDNYADALQQAFFELDRNKRQYTFGPEPVLHCGFVRECDSCSAMASCVTTYAGDTRLLCMSCHLKTRQGRRRGHWKALARYLEAVGLSAKTIEDLRPDDFEQIGARCQAKPGYTAVVYGDGNAMGKIVKTIDNEDRFRLFSETVSMSLQEACYEAIWDCCLQVNGKIPADILLLGGDDIMVYLAADTAMPFAIELAKAFERKTTERIGKDPFFRNLLQGKGFTISLGLAYGRSHTPIAILVDQAEELLKSAKQRGSGITTNDYYAPCCIDFHLASRYNQIHVKDSRSDHLTLNTARGRTLRLYGGPYTLPEAENFLNQARLLKRSGLPRSRLHRLGEAPFEGYEMGNLETLITWGRTRKEEHRNALYETLNALGCLPFPPWRETGETIDTPIVDLVSLTEWTTG